MKLNVGKALTAEAERKAKPVPIPVIKKKTITATTSNAGLAEQPVIINAEDLQVDKSNVLLDNILIGQLEAERHSLVLDRKKLSTRTASLVDEIYQRLNEKEGAAAAVEFMN